MPEFIVLFSDHRWFACYNLNEAREIIKNHTFTTPQNCIRYAKIIRNGGEIPHNIPLKPYGKL